MTLRHFAIVGLLALACGAPPRPGGPTAPAGPRFIVPHDGAIIEVDVEGRLLRTIARVPAEEIRLLPGGAFLAYDAGMLRRVRPDGHVDLTVALPTAGHCGDGADDSGLFPQFGISVDRQGRTASAIMAEFEYDAAWNIAVTVCLDTGRVYVDPASVQEGCTLTPAPILGPPPCARGVEPSAAPEDEDEDERLPDAHAHQYGFDVKDANVVRREGDRVTIVGGPLLAYDSTSVHSISPSGRWLLLQGPELTASSLYYSWLLFDRQTGSAYPLPDKATARWPAPLGPRAFVEPGRDVRWLSYTARPFRWHPGGGDLLLVGQLLVRPGERVIDLGGRPAE